jgi:alpha-tubulin suppressor-like RCC1 family protein
LGNGTLTRSSTPVQTVQLSGAVALAAGGFHTCAVLTGGSVKCWGYDSFGQLGNGAFGPPSPTPAATAPLSQTFGVGAVEITTGRFHTCARLSDGLVDCWGSNFFGQLGSGTTNIVNVPIRSNIITPAVAVTAGIYHTCAIAADGTASCWGENALGQVLPNGPTLQLSPGPPVPSLANTVEISAGELHTCAATGDGQIRCWGSNQYGQHGDGNTLLSGVDSVAGVIGTFLARRVTAGNQFTCGVRGAGAAACWGAGTHGQLGDSAASSSANPVAVTGLANAIAISAGSSAHACMIDGQGGAQCWGSNSSGQLGNNTTISSARPVHVAAGTAPFTGIAVGDAHTCALTANGAVNCWGAADRGQLGSGGTVNSPAPGVVFGVSNAVGVVAGIKFACALLATGQVSCWGDNTANQLGDGGAQPFSKLPVPVPGLLNAVAISAGSSHVCALTAAGTVSCWGANTRGQIGNNSTVPASFPTTVQGLTDAVSISAGAYFTCAARAPGIASCWGANDSGELAAVDNVDHLTPTVVASSIFFLPTGGVSFLSLGGVVDVATGTNPALPAQEHACALLVSGNIKCWGNNSQGEIGDGTLINRARPTTVNSFLANVDPAAVLRNRRIAEVTALLNCEEDGRAQIILTLEQGGASGTGHAEAACEGRLIRVSMNVPAQGPSAFEAGPATAHVEAIVRNEGAIVEDTHWTKAVVLSAVER